MKKNFFSSKFSAGIFMALATVGLFSNQAKAATSINYSGPVLYAGSYGTTQCLVSTGDSYGGTNQCSGGQLIFDCSTPAGKIAFESIMKAMDITAQREVANRQTWTAQAVSQAAGHPVNVGIFDAAHISMGFMKDDSGSCTSLSYLVIIR